MVRFFFRQTLVPKLQVLKVEISQISSHLTQFCKLMKKKDFSRFRKRNAIFFRDAPFPSICMNIICKLSCKNFRKIEPPRILLFGLNPTAKKLLKPTKIQSEEFTVMTSINQKIKYLETLRFTSVLPQSTLLNLNLKIEVIRSIWGNLPRNTSTYLK